MALKLKFNICQNTDCKTVSYSELTGIFSTGNTTGWNDSSTAYIADITTATLSITSPIATTPTIIDIFNIITPNGFPTTDSPSLEYDLTSINIVGSNTIATLDDGLYTFKYEVYDATNDQYYSTTKEVAFLCQSKCCVQKFAKKVGEGSCCDGCANEDMDKFLTGFALLKTLEALSGGCGNTEEFNKTLKTLTNLCKNNACGCS